MRTSKLKLAQVAKWLLQLSFEYLQEMKTPQSLCVHVPVMTNFMVI